MKKFLLSAACLLGFVAMNANEASITFSEEGYTNAEKLSTVTVNNDITLTFSKGAGSTDPAYYNAGTAARLYAKNTLTITCTNGNLQQVVFTTGTGDYVFNAESKVDDGSFAIDGSTAVWTGNASEFTVTQGGAKGHVRISSIEFTYGESEGPVAPAAPTFDPASGLVEAGTEVTISCTTEGAEIHYTLDGTQPTPNSARYTTPIVVNEDLTIKAISFKDGVESKVATASYTVPVVYTKLADVIALDNKEGFYFKGELVVVYANGSYNYVYDGETYALIYKYNLGLNAGDKITEAWAGNVSVYNNLVELVPAGGLTADGTGVIPEPAAVNAGNLDEYWSASMQNTYVCFEEVQVTTGEAGTVYSIGDEVLTFYNRFNIDMPTDECLYKVTGFMSVFKDDVQLYPTEFTIAEGVETVAAANAAPVEYFNLQGIRVANPENGFYIRRQGNEVSKVVIR